MHTIGSGPDVDERRSGNPIRLISVEGPNMLKWALIFLVIALIAAALGFGGIAGASAGIAKILFFVFLVIFVISLIMHLVRRV